ncbi:UNVERIFIED_CONTAM: 2-phytyl-1,4-beta-naphthoquinone methyltransferase, chloroplastic [Sesamum angustifolium]|uniref:2-phytyl-1,4-beta-naphthoquinone methyltransferase, chloroplastic n=1 Tax=Sesamum angustifolium TaxID=2727405 RepID=A0AAW2Q8Z1_9LAMI
MDTVWRRRPESEAVTHEGAAERQELFNRIAPVYDKMNDVFTLGFHRLWKRWTVSWSGAKQGDKVLDVLRWGSELSAVRESWNQWQGNCWIKELLQIAASRQRQLQRSKPCYKNIEWFEEDAVKLPFPDSTFDAATIGFGLRNIVEREKALQEMSRVLKPGAKLSVLDFNKSTSRLTSIFQVSVRYREVELLSVPLIVALGVFLLEDGQVDRCVSIVSCVFVLVACCVELLSIVF